MFTHPEQIDRNNVVQFINFLMHRFYHATYRWEKLTRNTELSHYVYVSTDCEYVTQSGVYYNVYKHAPCNVFNDDVLPGKLYRLVHGNDHVLGVLIGEQNTLYFIMLDSPDLSDMRMVDWACRKIANKYETPLIRVNLNLEARCLIQSYNLDLTTQTYPHFPLQSMSISSTNHEIMIKRAWLHEWNKEPVPPYAKPMFKRLTELNRILDKSGHSFEIRVN